MKTHKITLDGFTLVELLVTMAVAGVVVGSLSQAVTGFVHISQRGRYLNIANSYVEAKIEAMRNIGYNSLALGSSSLTGELSSQLPPSRSSTMVITSPFLGLKKIDITISYNDQGQNNSFSYATYIGELGVGQ